MYSVIINYVQITEIAKLNTQILKKYEFWVFSMSMQERMQQIDKMTPSGVIGYLAWRRGAGCNLLGAECNLRGVGHGLRDAGCEMLSLILGFQTCQLGLCFAHVVTIHWYKNAFFTFCSVILCELTRIPHRGGGQQANFHSNSEWWMSRADWIHMALSISEWKFAGWPPPRQFV